MQSKISTFFKPRHNTVTLDPIQDSDNRLPSNNNDSQVLAVEETSSPNHKQFSHYTISSSDDLQNEASKTNNWKDFTLKPCRDSAKTLNKKRNYAQLHLDLGQSDFLLHTCSVCSFKYACGDAEDEKVHKEFHKDYTQGIQFKGWHNERIIDVPSNDLGRIIMVIDGDPPAHKKKIEKVIELMEPELGSGWLTHKLCKVYLLIFHQRVAGCLVAEPIKDAYKVILSNSEAQQSLGTTTANKKRSRFSTLRFGDINFKRETVRTPANETKAPEEEAIGAMFIDNEAVPAVCGIRAIWVAPSMRRKHIATQLLDAARISFCDDIVLKPSQLAFSDPTSMGKAFAVKYCTTSSFLAYKCKV